MRPEAGQATMAAVEAVMAKTAAAQSGEAAAAATPPAMTAGPAVSTIRAATIAASNFSRQLEGIMPNIGH